jgi:glycosyltransferase involved in cell wall biosynthesis
MSTPAPVAHIGHAGAPTAATRGRIGYLVRSFPRTSETFIINEIIELERQGFDLRIYSMIDATDAVRHRLVDRIRAPIRYLPNPVWRSLNTIIADHWWLLSRSPKGYLAALVRVIGSGDLAVLAHFPQAASLARALAGDGVTHLHAGFVHAPGSLAYLVSLMTGVPYSLATHARDLYRSSPVLLRKKLATARAVFTCTRYNVAHLERLLNGTASIRVQHVYHGTNLERFPYRPCGRGRPPVILAVARLVEKKGLDDLIRACALLAQRGREFRCHIVGNGAQKTRLTELLRQLGLERCVAIEPAVDQEELIEWYRRASVMALPCRIARDGDRDGIPNVLIEAAACGVPIVTTPVSGIPELVTDGWSGLFVRPCDPASLADAIDRLLESADLRERVRRRARQIVEERFDLRRNALTIGRELRAAMKSEDSRH